MTAVLKIRSTVFNAIHEYFRNNGFYEYQSPIFQAVQCEGGSILFNVDYFGKKGITSRKTKKDTRQRINLQQIEKHILQQDPFIQDFRRYI